MAGLVCGSIGWMICLVGLHVRRDGVRARRRIDEAALVNLLVSLALAPTPELRERLIPYVRQTGLMAEVLLEFDSLMRGDEREKVFALLRELGLGEGLRRGFMRRGRRGRVYAEALAALGGPHATGALEQAAETHRDPQVRMAALRYAVARGSGRGLRRLLGDFAITQKGGFSLHLVDLVREMTAADPREAVEALEDAALPGRLRALLLDALGLSGDYLAIDTLVAAAAEPDLEVRTAAVRGLGRLMHPAAQATIATALHDPEWVVRTAAAEAVGRTGLAELAEPLAGLLADPEWWVRLRAAEALGQLGEPGLRRLREAAANGEDVTRRVAEAALAEQAAA